MMILDSGLLFGPPCIVLEVSCFSNVSVISLSKSLPDIGRAGPPATCHLSGWTVGPPARWAATSNAEGGR